MSPFKLYKRAGKCFEYHKRSRINQSGVSRWLWIVSQESPFSVLYHTWIYFFTLQYHPSRVIERDCIKYTSCLLCSLNSFFCCTCLWVINNCAISKTCSTLVQGEVNLNQLNQASLLIVHCSRLFYVHICARRCNTQDWIKRTTETGHLELHEANTVTFICSEGKVPLHLLWCSFRAVNVAAFVLIALLTVSHSLYTAFLCFLFLANFIFSVFISPIDLAQVPLISVYGQQQK